MPKMGDREPAKAAKGSWFGRGSWGEKIAREELGGPRARSPRTDAQVDGTRGLQLAEGRPPVHTKKSVPNHAPGS